jgi:hypothetical protein
MGRLRRCVPWLVSTDLSGPHDVCAGSAAAHFEAPPGCPEIRPSAVGTPAKVSRCSMLCMASRRLTTPWCVAGGHARGVGTRPHREKYAARYLSWYLLPKNIDGNLSADGERAMRPPRPPGRAVGSHLPLGAMNRAGLREETRAPARVHHRGQLARSPKRVRLLPESHRHELAGRCFARAKGAQLEFGRVLASSDGLAGNGGVSCEQPILSGPTAPVTWPSQSTTPGRYRRLRLR